MAENLVPNEFIAQLLKLPSHQVWIDHDTQADVIYISFRKPQQANDSIMEDDGNIYHYHNDELVGITILNVAQKLKK
jgi:uncharacterized protein YuzE